MQTLLDLLAALALATYDAMRGHTPYPEDAL